MVRHVLISVDAKGYGGATARGHQRIQEGLLRVLDQAAERAGLARRTWTRQPGGDGELAILPPSEPEPKVVEDFPRALASALRVHNRDLHPRFRLRLRLAVHHGVALPAPNGYAGDGPVAVSRLCDSRPLKDALAASGADLAVVYSRRVVDDVIRQELTGLSTEALREVRVVRKEFDEPAWIWIPEGDVNALALPSIENGAPHAPATAGNAQVEADGLSGTGTGAPAEPDRAADADRAADRRGSEKAGRQDAEPWTAAETALRNPDAPDAVICFAQEDKATVERLALKLLRRGVKVWIQPWVEPGLVVLLEKERAIRTAPNGVLVFSRAALARREVQEDYAALLHRVHEPGGRRFIPVLVEDVPLPPYAALRRELDLTGDPADEEKHIDLLARALRSGSVH